jgi:hypothetical protein
MFLSDFLWKLQNLLNLFPFPPFFLPCSSYTINERDIYLVLTIMPVIWLFLPFYSHVIANNSSPHLLSNRALFYLLVCCNHFNQ